MADGKDNCSMDSNDSERLRFLDDETDCLTVLLQRQRDNNHALRQQYQDQMHNVRVLQEENAAIMRMVAALQPHKFSFTLEPADNLTSLADRFCSEPGIPAFRFASEQSQQPAGHRGTQFQSQQQFEGHASAQPQEAEGMQPEDDEYNAASEAEVEAVAAAALAVNRGNPAAALIDLLNLARKRRLVANNAGGSAGL